MGRDTTPPRHVQREHPLLGTVVEVVVTGGSEPNARAVAATVVAEIERLEGVLSAFRDDSELNAWKRDEVDAPSVDLCAVLAAAWEWQQRSGGLFNPLAGELSAIWSVAEREGVAPSASQLSEAVAAIRVPRYEMRHGVPVRLGDCSHLNLNAIAKGYIVDRGLALASLDGGVLSVVVSAGGDLAHRGDEPSRVGIENPLRPFDNEPPVAFVSLRNAGLATSGGARRGVRIGSEWFSHVLDPRTGQPVDTQASISVVAPSAVEADVLATIAGAMRPADAVDDIEARAQIGCLIVERNGQLISDSTWARLARPRM